MVRAALFALSGEVEGLSPFPHDDDDDDYTTRRRFFRPSFDEANVDRPIGSPPKLGQSLMRTGENLVTQASLPSERASARGGGPECTTTDALCLAGA